MTHLFRPGDPDPANLSPSWKAWRGLLIVELWRWLAPFARAARSQRLRAVLGPLLLILGFVVQLVLVGLAGALVEISIDLADMWAQLARKHLEITL